MSAKVFQLYIFLFTLNFVITVGEDSIGKILYSRTSNGLVE